MKTKQLGKVLLMLVLMVGLLAPATVVKAKSKIWKLKVQAYAAKSLDPQYVSPAKLADFIREYTDGRVDITVYPMMELVPPREIYSAVGRRVVDGGITIDAYIAGAHPEASWALNPAVISKSEDFYTCIEAGVKDILDREIMKDNIKMATVWDLYPAVYGHRKKLIKTLADFKGQKMRGYGGMADEFMKAIGTGIVVMPMAEVYSAMQTGVLDGLATGLPGYMSMKGYEVAPYLTIGDKVTGFWTMMLILNLDLWNEFPKEIKEGIHKAEKAHWKWHIDYLKRYRVEGEEFFKKNGATVYVLPPDEAARWREAFESVATPWYLKKSGDKGREIFAIVEKTLGKKLLQ